MIFQSMRDTFPSDDSRGFWGIPNKVLRWFSWGEQHQISQMSETHSFAWLSSNSHFRFLGTGLGTRRGHKIPEMVSAQGLETLCKRKCEMEERCAEEGRGGRKFAECTRNESKTGS